MVKPPDFLLTLIERVVAVVRADPNMRRRQRALRQLEMDIRMEYRGTRHYIAKNTPQDRADRADARR
jgi:hypothetical protein